MTDTITVAEYRHKISEHQLQVLVLDYIEREKATPDIYVIAIPNGGLRSFAVARKLKREGVRAGVADLGILLPQGRDGVARTEDQERPAVAGAEGVCRDAASGSAIPTRWRRISMRR